MAEQKPAAPQVIRQGLGNNQSQNAAVIALIVVVGVIIGALYLAQATITTTTGTQLQAYAVTQDYLQRANEEVQAEIAFKRNLNTLRGRAQDLGFVPIDKSKQEYIVIPGYSPIRATPTPVATIAPTLVYDETFNGWVKQQWDLLVNQFEAWSREKTTPTPTKP